MLAFDDIVPNYRSAMERWKDAPTLGKHYASLAAKHKGNDHGLLETVKSFIECVCLTILSEYGKPMPSATPTTTELLVECLRTLGLHNSPGAGELGAILKAHNKLADALSNMRNTSGPVAHGKDGFRDCLTTNQTRVFLLTGDTLLGLILTALDGIEPDLKYSREPYERFEHLHQRIDQSVVVKASVDQDGDQQIIVLTLETGALPDGVELRIEPSRLLYCIDRTAYLELLAASADELTKEAEVPVDAPVVGNAAATESNEESPVVSLVPLYSGELTRFRDELNRYIQSMGVLEVSARTDGAQLPESLLASAEANMGTDWTDRETLQSRMKVALRRVLIQFGITGSNSDKYAEHVVSWLRIQLAGLPNDVVETTDVK